MQIALLPAGLCTSTAQAKREGHEPPYMYSTKHTQVLTTTIISRGGEYDKMPEPSGS